MFKNSEKEEIQCEIVELDHVYKTNDYTDFKIETVDNFPLPFNEFYISQDSFKDMVDKYVVNISLTDGVIKHIEYSTRGRIIWGGSIEEKNSQHLIFTLQLLIK